MRQMISALRCSVLGALVLSAPVAEDSEASAQAAPRIETIPGLENFSIERPPATPRPVPTATPTSSATPIPVPPAPRLVLPTVRPTPRATPRPAATPTALPEPSPSPAPVAVATPTPVAVATPTPLRVPPPAVVEAPPAVPRDEERADSSWWPYAAALLVLGVAAAFLLRRRSPAEHVVEEEAPSEPPRPGAIGTRQVPASSLRGIPPAATSRLGIVLRPIRAGLNLLSATAECEVIVTNTGAQPAIDIRVGLRLLSAGNGQEAELAAVFAEPIVRPVVPPFTLQPGEERGVRGVTALSRDAIRPIAAAGRPMFVPLVTVNLLYTSNGAPKQTARAFAIGVERVDSVKLAPLWLDAAPRMHDAVAARPHDVALER